MNILELLGNITQRDPLAPTSAINQAIKEIIQHANRQYSDVRYFGNAALNRQLLLDAYVADRLTPEVILYLYTNRANEFQLQREDTTIPLTAAISYGLADGLHVLKHIPNNERKYGLAEYSAQQENYKRNTLKILENIWINLQPNPGITLAQFISEQEAIPLDSLVEQLNAIKQTINAIKTNGKSAELLFVPGYTTDQIREQVVRGFNALVRCTLGEGIKEDTETMEDFCVKCLQDPNAFLDGTVIHQFYDRVHLEAALEQQTKIKFKDGDFEFSQILMCMASLLDSRKKDFPLSTIEQFQIRFYLVKKDLALRGPQLLKPLEAEEIPEPPELPVLSDAPAAAASPAVELTQEQFEDDILPSIKIMDKAGWSLSATKQAVEILKMYSTFLKVKCPVLSNKIQSLIQFTFEQLEHNNLARKIDEQYQIVAGDYMKRGYSSDPASYKKALTVDPEHLCRLTTITVSFLLDKGSMSTYRYRFNIESFQIEGYPRLKKCSGSDRTLHPWIDNIPMYILNNDKLFYKADEDAEIIEIKLPEANKDDTLQKLHLIFASASFRTTDEELSQITSLTQFAHPPHKHYTTMANLMNEIVDAEQLRLKAMRSSKDKEVRTIIKSIQQITGVSYPYQEALFQADEALIKQTLKLLLEKFAYSTSLAQEEESKDDKVPHEADLSSITNTPTIASLLKEGNIEQLCKELKENNEELLAEFEKEIINSQEIVHEINPNLTVSQWYHEYKQKLSISSAEDPPMGAILQSMYDENTPYFKSFIEPNLITNAQTTKASHLNRPYVIDQQHHLPSISLDDIQTIIKQGRLERVCKNIDEDFMMDMEALVAKTPVEFTDSNGKSVRISDLYSKVKTKLHSKLREQKITTPAPFGDILQGMYTEESPYYRKLNAIMQGSDHQGRPTEEETAFAILLQVAQHKSGLDKAIDEMQQHPLELFRGDKIIPPNFKKKIELFQRYNANGCLTLSKEQLEKLSVTDFFSKKMLSTTMIDETASTFAVSKEQTSTMVCHIINPQDLADFYSIDNVSMARIPESEFISRIKDDVVLIPIYMEEVKGTLKVELYAIRSDILLPHTSEFIQGHTKLLNLIEAEIHFTEDPELLRELKTLKSILQTAIAQEAEKTDKDKTLLLLMGTMTNVMSKVLASERKPYYDAINTDLSVFIAIYQEIDLTHLHFGKKLIAEKKLEIKLQRLERWWVNNEIKLQKWSEEEDEEKKDSSELTPNLLKTYLTTLLSKEDYSNKILAAKSINEILNKHPKLSIQYPKLSNVIKNIIGTLDVITHKPLKIEFEKLSLTKVIGFFAEKPKIKKEQEVSAASAKRPE